METYYLVDFENVNSKAISNCKNFDSKDHLVIFYTENAKSIDLDIINNHGNSELKSVKVPAKKQSVDMHIVSYMGYLIGKYGMTVKIIIISKDTDYYSIIEYYKNKGNLVRGEKIDAVCSKTKQNANNSQKMKQLVKSVVNSSMPAKKKSDSENRKQLNNDIQKILSKNKFSSEIIGEVAKIAVKQYGKDNYKQRVHNDLRNKFPFGYEAIYKIVKPTLNKYS